MTEQEASALVELLNRITHLSQPEKLWLQALVERLTIKVSDVIQDEGDSTKEPLPH